MIAVDNISGIFADAAAANLSGDGVFFSLWGRTASLMSLYGQVVNTQIHSLVIDGTHYALDKDMEKTHIRLPKDNPYGSDLAHAFIYRKSTIEETAGQRIVLGKEKPLDDDIWAALNALSELALLPAWKAPLLQQLEAVGMIQSLTQRYGITGVVIDMRDRDQFEALISTALRNGVLAETLCEN